MEEKDKEKIKKINKKIDINLDTIKLRKNEGTYNEFRKDETRSSNRKINDSIKNINRTIYEVERVVD